MKQNSDAGSDHTFVKIDLGSNQYIIVPVSPLTVLRDLLPVLAKKRRINFYNEQYVFKLTDDDQVC